jgi:hypothetical protein
MTEAPCGCSVAVPLFYGDPDAPWDEITQKRMSECTITFCAEHRANAEARHRIEHLEAALRLADEIITRSMDLAQYPRECWGVDQDEDLKDLFSKCAELYGARVRLGLVERRDAGVSNGGP